MREVIQTLLTDAAIRDRSEIERKAVEFGQVGQPWELVE